MCDVPIHPQGFCGFWSPAAAFSAPLPAGDEGAHRLILGAGLLEVLIEPIDHQIQVLVQTDEPAVSGTLFWHQLRLDPDALQLLHERLGLLEWHQLIGVAMDDQRGRVVGGDVGDRGYLPRDLAEPLGVGDRYPDVGLLVELAVVEGGSERQVVIGRMDHLPTRPAVVEQVGGREQASHSLHPTRLAIDRVPGVLVALVPGGS